MTSPHQWMSGETWGPANSVAPETAQLDNAEAAAAVAAADTARGGAGVTDVANMSNPGTHRAGG